MDSKYPHMPKKEIRSRIDRLRSHMTTQGIEGALLFSTIELFYYSGVGLEGALFIPQEGEPTHLIKRNVELAKEYSAIITVRDFGRLSKVFSTLPIKDGSRIALELDILPYSYTKYLESLNKKITFLDGSLLFRKIRAVKSDFEVNQIAQAATLVDQSFEYCVDIALPEMSEIELAAKLHQWLLENGHHGYVHTRAFNSALVNFSYVIGSSSSVLNIHFTPISGWGMSLKHPYGPSTMKLGKNPFFVDTCGNFNGYISDTTRTFAFGQFDRESKNQMDALIQIKQLLQKRLKPNVHLGDLYSETMELAKELHIFDHFMGETNNKVKFLGHGIGLELDELPILSAKSNVANQGNVLACEPKYIERGRKVLGLEDSYALTDSGNRLLSQSPNYFEI